MGNRSTVLSKEELDSLQVKTHYSRRELVQLYKQFREEVTNPAGVIPKEDFFQLANLLGIKDLFLAEILFQGFDRSRDGVIDFREFITSMSIVSRGTTDEKLEFAFSLFDLDHDGYITHGEMTKIVTSLYQLLGEGAPREGDKFSNPESLVSTIFQEMDTNQDGLLSLEEYKAGALRDTAIVQGLCLF